MTGRQTSLLLSFVVLMVALSAILVRATGNSATQFGDFYVYLFAAQTLHENPHGDIYFGDLDANPQNRVAEEGSPLLENAHRSGREQTELYLYPPLTADLLIPLASLPPHRAATIWHVLNLCLLLASLILLARMAEISIWSADFVVLAACAYCFFPIVQALDAGQVTVILLFLWTLAISTYTDGKIAISACALAIATAFKVTPLLVVPLFVLWKNWRWLIVYFSTLGSLAAAMAAYNGIAMIEKAGKVLSWMSKGGVTTTTNRCIDSVVDWLYYGNFTGPATPPASLTAISHVVCLVYLAVCGYLAWRINDRLEPQSRITVLAAFSLISVLCSPVSWRHAYTLAFIPICLVWAAALRNPFSKSRILVLGIASFAVGTTYLDHVAWRPYPMPLRIAAASLEPLACMVFCIQLLAIPMAFGNRQSVSRETLPYSSG